jgi:hypothetical protein
MRHLEVMLTYSTDKFVDKNLQTFHNWTKLMTTPLFST